MRPPLSHASNAKASLTPPLAFRISRYVSVPATASPALPMPKMPCSALLLMPPAQSLPVKKPTPAELAVCSVTRAKRMRKACTPELICTVSLTAVPVQPLPAP